MPFFIQVISLIVIIGAILAAYYRHHWSVHTASLAAMTLAQFIHALYLDAIWLSLINLAFWGTVTTIFGYTGRNYASQTAEENYTGTGFRLASGFFFILIGFAAAYGATGWLINVPYLIIAAGLVLVLSGIYLLNYYRKSIEVTFALLVFLSGFELIYSSLESSILVCLLLGGVKLALVFINWFLLSGSKAEGLS